MQISVDAIHRVIRDAFSRAGIRMAGTALRHTPAVGWSAVVQLDQGSRRRAAAPLTERLRSSTRRPIA
jgi:hypothetical protein